MESQLSLAESTERELEELRAEIRILRRALEMALPGYLDRARQQESSQPS